MKGFFLNVCMPTVNIQFDNFYQFGRLPLFRRQKRRNFNYVKPK